MLEIYSEYPKSYVVITFDSIIQIVHTIYVLELTHAYLHTCVWHVDHVVVHAIDGFLDFSASLICNLLGKQCPGCGRNGLHIFVAKQLAEHAGLH